ncbi:MAG TPA: SIMPL domain-containing protein [Rhizomicrobium sp.]|jgi:hypothetical protein
MNHRLNAGVLAALLLVVAAPCAAQQAPGRVIEMTGQGSVAVMPDQAMVTGGVVSDAKAAADAVAANSRTMNRVVAALKAMGIPDKDIHTTRFDLEPQYAAADAKSGQPRHIAGYEATNGVSVRLDDINRAGAVLDTLIAAGANQSVNVDFDIKDRKPALAEARKKAAQDALERAQAYAGTLGDALGPVLSITEGQGDYVMAGGARMKPQGLYSSSPVTVMASEQTVDATVTVEWTLK